MAVKSIRIAKRVYREVVMSTEIYEEFSKCDHFLHGQPSAVDTFKKVDAVLTRTAGRNLSAEEVSKDRKYVLDALLTEQLQQASH